MNPIKQHTSIEGGQRNTPQSVIVGGVEEIMQKFPSEAIAQLPEQKENIGALLSTLEKAVETRGEEIGYDYGDYKNRLYQSDEVLERTLEENVLNRNIGKRFRFVGKEKYEKTEIGELYSQIVEAFPESSRDVARQKITKEYLEDLVFESMEKEDLVLESMEDKHLRHRGLEKQKSAIQKENLQRYLRKIEELKGSRVKYLDLGVHDLGIYLGADGVVKLVEALKGSGVRSLNLKDNNLGKYLGADGIMRLVEALKSNGIRSLNLGGNKLGEYLGADGVVKFAEALRGSGMRSLDLGGNALRRYLGVDEIVKITESLKGSGVKYLNLSWNDLGYLGVGDVVKIMESLKGSGVRSLNLGGNGLGDEDKERLKKQFPDMHFIF